MTLPAPLVRGFPDAQRNFEQLKDAPETLEGLEAAVAALDTRLDALEAMDATAWVEVGSGGGAPAFKNAWVNKGGAYETAAFRKNHDGTRVEFKGTLHGGTLNSTAFTLPAGYWPAKDRRIAIGGLEGVTRSSMMAYVNATNGDVAIFGVANDEVYLETGFSL